MEIPYDEDGGIPELPVSFVLIMKDGTRLIVGDVNTKGGRCDCCRFDYASVERIEPPSVSARNAG